MMTYPTNCALLTQEEMEYTTGGFSINWGGLAATLMGTVTSALAYLNVANIAGVSEELKKQAPEKYPEPEGTINGSLLLDATVAFYTTVPGVMLGLLTVGAGVGTVYLTMQFK